MEYDRFIALLIQAMNSRNPADIDRVLNTSVECFNCKKVIDAEDDFEVSAETGDLRCPYCKVLWVKFGRKED